MSARHDRPSTSRFLPAGKAGGDVRRQHSWGRYPRASGRVWRLHWCAGPIPADLGAPLLPYGLGRSYGDACLNDGGTLLCTRGLDRFVALDAEAGTVECEAGVSLGELLDLVVPHGLFLPVLPGTTHVTVGGAIANDVHGKNHHRAGTFGCHVVELEVLRSSGERLVCTPTSNADLFRATVGGLGLTGLVLRARLRLERRPDALVAEAVPLRGLGEFFELVEESDSANEFTVAWVDCQAGGAKLGRGILHRGSFAAAGKRGTPPNFSRPARFSVPVDLPIGVLNRLTVSAFNALYGARAVHARRPVEPRSFLFPLDAVARWNRIYGRAGFQQFQCVVPPDSAPTATAELLEITARSGEGSFLAVLKRFGTVRSPGLLSFPREGVTLALDFPNRRATTDRLFRELHAVVAAHRGRLYPAKDACMSAAQFHVQYADVLPGFLRHRDPAFSSSFWRRVNGDG